MKTAGLNLSGFAAAVGLSTAIGGLPTGAGPSGFAFSPTDEQPAQGGAPGSSVRDASGHSVSIRPYRRIVSASATADELLLDLCEPDRIAAFTPYTDRARAFRFAGKPTVQLHDLEGILSLGPDLVLVSGNGDMQPILRLREVGVNLFDLGDARGMSTLVPNIHEIAALVGHPERGDRFALDFVSAMATVAADIPSSGRRRAMYLSVYGGRLFGGASGTSYDDVIAAAGLVEAAAGYRDWPTYAPDDVLAIDPDVIVTTTAMRDRICEHAGLSGLRACGAAGRIVEIQSALLSDAGPDMLSAAQAVRLAVYGPPGGVR
jgi:iron complex transport system substrate-binding protein